MDEQDYAPSEYTHLVMCGEPTIIEGLRFAKELILVNVFGRFVLQYVTMPNFAKHSFSLLLGSFLLYNTVGFAFLWTAALTVSSYTLLMASTLLLKRHRGALCSVFVLAFLLCSEFLFVNSQMWQQIRGIQMVAAMKVISVALDLDQGFLLAAPSPAAFAGYIICPANCVLGPWVSFHKYSESLQRKYITRTWFACVLKYTLCSLVALLLSNCLVPWYISDDSFKWWVAYRDAQAFRMSHYFVSLLSTAIMIAAGYGEKDGGTWRVVITEPLFIEVPRSLVSVVVCWNVPMHQWLKTYVFKKFQARGKVVAISMTYVVSALLHGLNFQLSAALLSIGALSFLEFQLRSKLGAALSACCLASPCRAGCGHARRRSHPCTAGLNLLFSLLALLHLSYLGVMFEASFALQETGYSYLHTIRKWAELDFGSHILGLFTYLLYHVF